MPVLNGTGLNPSGSNHAKPDSKAVRMQWQQKLLLPGCAEDSPISKFDPQCFIVVSLQFLSGPGTAETDAAVLDPLGSLPISREQRHRSLEGRDEAADAVAADEEMEERADDHGSLQIGLPALEGRVRGVKIAGNLAEAPVFSLGKEALAQGY